MRDSEPDSGPKWRCKLSHFSTIITISSRLIFSRRAFSEPAMTSTSGVGAGSGMYVLVNVAHAGFICDLSFGATLTAALRAKCSRYLTRRDIEGVDAGEGLVPPRARRVALFTNSASGKSALFSCCRLSPAAPSCSHSTPARRSGHPQSGYQAPRTVH